MGQSILVFIFASALFLLSDASPNPSNPPKPPVPPHPFQESEEQALLYLSELEGRYSGACNRQITVRWNYITNVTNATASESTAADTEYLNFQSSIQNEILTRFPTWSSFQNDTVRREFKYLAIRGPATMPAADVAAMTRLQSEMETAFATLGVCEYNNPSNCGLRLDPEIEEKLSTVRDPDELAHYWTAWHDAMSEAVPPLKYQQFLSYQSAMARANGFRDMSEMWMVTYDDETTGWTAEQFKNLIRNLWVQIKPLYEKLHAYVRMKLRRIPEYEPLIEKCGYIPAQLTGNMWSQDWSTLDNITKPYPDAVSLDATEAMLKKNYTALRMFQEADKFFTDMGLEPMTESFWNKSMLERPDDGREVVCHASAEDFCLGRGSQDFRIKQCTKVTMDQLVTAHHEMGHIEYFQQYTDKDYIFREGANPGFHEAIGDALALAVVTPSHLQCVLELDMGLDPAICNEDYYRQAEGNVTETDINYLYITALQKLVFFPFAISMDSWRWEAFEGNLSPQKYNDRWWELRTQNQGIKSPSNRTSPNLFDPAAKYHIVSNVEYLRYFISHILQFQFYESMCIAAGQFDPESTTSKPLYQCDFSGSKEAGKLLGDMMKLGFSKGWPVALEAMTGTRDMSILPLANYFKPLLEYIDKELAANGETPGFGESCEAVAKYYINTVFEKEASEWGEKSAQAKWNYVTNLKNETAKNISQEVSLQVATYSKREWEQVIRHFDYKSFQDPSLKRQLQMLNVIGTAALPEEKLKVYNEISSEMTEIYGTAKICPYNNQTCDLEKDGLALNPGIEKVLTESEDYEELAYTWKAWRDATGRKLRPSYNKFVDLGNEAAQLNGFDNLKGMWLRKYESSSFEKDCEYLWSQVKPLYEELHGYARYKLRTKYPQIKSEDPIPGNMWSQSWEHLDKLLSPFPNASTFDVTEALKKKYTPDLAGVSKMFDVANEFFVSLGLSDMSVSYGPKAQLVKPNDREVVCHASAWDFSNKKDFRIKMCTKVNQEDFVTIHHELGHIQYYINYKNLPETFREGANPGFHEAIGDVMALSVSTPKHMMKIGLAENKASLSKESTINYLMNVGLKKVMVKFKI
ncbi:unnamed protein product [Orchesella dallaii]|uniref:Angiotensin-converting enzyme n=1 Tax=Orchesella dallaii TaxID=48710 RepID=A0ABP1QAG4_9HEXA